MRKLFYLMGIFLFTNQLNAQWTTNGSNIYNSNAGNVGIGVSNPGDKLAVAGGWIHGFSGVIADQTVPGTMSGWFRGASGGNGSIVLQANAGGGDAFWMTAQSGTLLIGANGGVEPTSGAINITGTGNVGIGTTHPAGVLSFADVNATNNPVGITWYSATGDPTMYGIHKTSGAWSGPNYQQIRIGWQTGIILDPGTAYGMSYVNVVGNGMRVTTGTVGIGTINTNDPNYKLFVETGIRTRRITVDQTVWPDYVFDSTYRMLSLSELARFINNNKHLPGIASATKIEKDGVDLGANQAVLLKKIEELTLYIIGQDKRIRAMQKHMAQIERRQKHLNTKSGI